jgi:hypothetical protein
MEVEEEAVAEATLEEEEEEESFSVFLNEVNKKFEN